MIEIFSTVLAAVIIFVLGQVFLRMLLDPIVEAKRTIAKIQVDQTRYRYIIGNYDEKADREKVEEIYSAYREYAGLLLAHLRSIPFYRYVYKVANLPCQENMEHAATQLVAISYLLGAKEGPQGNLEVGYRELNESLGLKSF